MPFAEGIWNDGLESGIRRRASRAARFARSRATLVQNYWKNEDTARYGQILPHTAKQGKIRLKYEELRARLILNTCKMRPKCQKGAKRSPKGITREPQGAKRAPQRCQRGAKWNQRRPNGAQREPKGCQKGAKSVPKGDQNASKNRSSEKVAKSIENGPK